MFPDFTCVWSFHIVLFYISVAPYSQYHHIQNLIILPRYYAARDFSSRVTSFTQCLGLIFFPIIFYHLCYCFLFKFTLLRHIYVGCTIISFCEQLSFNPFSLTFVHFIIVVLTCYYLKSYSTVLTMYISDMVFRLWSICFRCIIYVTN